MLPCRCAPQIPSRRCIGCAMLGRWVFTATLLAPPFIGACASTSSASLPRYQPPAQDAPSAELINNNLGATAARGSGGHVSLIDGTEAPSFSGSVRLAAGVHKIGVDCLATSTSGIAYAGPKLPVVPVVQSDLQHVVITGTFTAGKKYFIRCAADGATQRTWLSDTPDGVTLPEGFDSVCTRSCGPSTP